MIGASSVGRLEQNAAALGNPELSAEELAEIDDELGEDGKVDLWASARRGEW